MILTIAVALLIACVEFAVIVIASPLAKPTIILRFLPDDIKEAAKHHPEPAKWKQWIAHGLLLIAGIVFIGGIVFLGNNGIAEDYSYFQLWLRFLIMFYIIKVFDIVVQDQLLIMTLGYYKKLYPETKDCAGWKRRSWNNKKQMVRIVLYPFICLVIAGIFFMEEFR